MHGRVRLYFQEKESPGSAAETGSVDIPSLLTERSGTRLKGEKETKEATKARTPEVVDSRIQGKETEHVQSYKEQGPITGRTGPLQGKSQAAAAACRGNKPMCYRHPLACTRAGLQQSYDSSSEQ